MKLYEVKVTLTVSEPEDTSDGALELTCEQIDARVAPVIDHLKTALLQAVPQDWKPRVEVR